MGVVEGSLRPEVGREAPPPIRDRPVVVVVGGSGREGVVVVENWLTVTLDAAVIGPKPNFIPVPNTDPIPVPEPD